MDRILVGIDLSEASSLALDTALALSEVTGAEVEAVYVISAQPPVTLWYDLPYLGPIADPALERELKRQFEEFVSTRAEKHAGMVGRVQTRVRNGFEYRELLAEAARFEASLIVVGSHGHTAVQRFFLGSVSSKILRRARLPVFVARGSSAPSRILVGVDLGESTEHVLRTAQAWQDALGAKLTIVHVLAPVSLHPPNVGLGQEVLPLHAAREKETRRSIESAVDKVIPRDSRPDVRFVEGQPYEVLCDVAQQAGDDLVIVGTHEKHGLFDLGDTAMRLAHRCQCSVLVARPPARRDVQERPDAGP